MNWISTAIEFNRLSIIKYLIRAGLPFSLPDAINQATLFHQQQILDFFN